MSPKITPDHLARAAVVYVRQSTLAQVIGNLESQRRQYALADAAKAAGFAAVTTIDDDLGRSGSGLMVRPGFQKLVAAVCAGHVGAVYCLEASRLARNGRDWHHLIDLCALAGALVIDLDGVYDPRHVNDELIAAIEEFISRQNACPRPLRWTKSADDILASIDRFCRRTLEVHAQSG